MVVFHIHEFSEKRGLPFFDNWPILNKGTEAVYVFFALSGFLIIRQLFNEKRETNTINLKSFYTRRALRIFPLYYLILSFGFMYYRIILPYFDYDVENNYKLIHGLLLSISFFPNIFSTYGPGGILEILWSIGVEEQFYLFIAPLFLWIPKKRIVLFLWTFTLLYFLLFSSGFANFTSKYNMLFFYFSFSGLCSVLLTKERFKKMIQKIRYPVLLVFILYFSTSLFQTHIKGVAYHIFGVLLLGLSIAALSQKPIRALENKTMHHLGKISYGIYMYHAIVMQFVGLIYLKLFSRFEMHNILASIIINLIIIAITILISHISYKYYETYFLNLKQKKGIKRR